MEEKQKMDNKKIVDESKKDYEKPELKVHGDLRDITKSGGGDQIDVPQGTPININDTTINDVTS